MRVSEMRVSENIKDIILDAENLNLSFFQFKVLAGVSLKMSI